MDIDLRGRIKPRRSSKSETEDRATSGKRKGNNERQNKAIGESKREDDVWFGEAGFRL